MVDVTVPQRAEAIFDQETGQFTVRYQTFFENVGVGVTESNTELESQLAGLESEIQKVSSFLGEINKDIAEIDAASANVSFLSAKMVQLEISINDAFALIPDQSNTLAKIAELEKRLRDVEELV